MNPLDILMIVLVSYWLVMGFFRGLVRELVSIAGVSGGFWAACTYYMNAAKYLSKWITEPSYLNISSFLIIFFGVFITIGIIGVIVKYLLKIITFGWVDRLSGGGCGLVKGVLIVSVLLMTFTAFLSKGVPVIRDSMLSPRVILISEKMAELVPKNMKREFVVKTEHLKKVWKTRIKN
ncbi:CvpA family protein [Desulfobacterales bacterium HSG2]|nr:CvpA family protein [Desulfobacterales bacterium HSG2]